MCSLTFLFSMQGMGLAAALAAWWLGGCFISVCPEIKSVRLARLPEPKFSIHF